MKTTVLLILFLPWLIACTGCGSKKDGIDWQADVRLKKKDGWKYEKIFGSPGAVAFEGYGESDTANSLTGYWIVNGERHTNEFKQDSRLYYLLTFAKTNGDAFLVVLSKDKPK
jgi:hypothetical protein